MRIEVSEVPKSEAPGAPALSGGTIRWHPGHPPWLGFAVGAAFLVFGIFGLRYMKEDAIAAASDDHDTAT